MIVFIGCHIQQCAVVCAVHPQSRRYAVVVPDHRGVLSAHAQQLHGQRPTPCAPACRRAWSASRGCAASTVHHRSFAGMQTRHPPSRSRRSPPCQVSVYAPPAKPAASVTGQARVSRASQHGRCWPKRTPAAGGFLCCFVARQREYPCRSVFLRSQWKEPGQLGPSYNALLYAVFAPMAKRHPCLATAEMVTTLPSMVDVGIPLP